MAKVFSIAASTGSIFAEDKKSKLFSAFEDQAYGLRRVIDEAEDIEGRDALFVAVPSEANAERLSEILGDNYIVTEGSELNPQYY